MMPVWAASIAFLAFMPHGHCYLWSPGLLWLHAVADSLIVLAYYSIPVSLVYVARKRGDLNFEWMFVAFAVFILACGTTHLVEIWNIWHADYWLAGGVKAVTALASILTTILLIRLIPTILRLPSPAALAHSNSLLEDEIKSRREAEAQTRALNTVLEASVADRTASLEEANAELRRQIAERQEIEDKLRASLREVDDLRAALNEHAIVATTDPRGKITSVNEKFCAISKYSREELLGQDHRLINSGHHPKEFIRDLWTTIGQGRVWKGEIKNRAKDGTTYWVDTTIVPFLDGDGNPRQYVAIRADITERKLAEEKLRASLKEVYDLKAALDEHAIVAITDPAGRITFVNDKFCAISKYSREELLGQDHRLINSGHHSKEFIRELWTTIRKGMVWKGEIKNKAMDGTFYWVDTTIVPFLDEEGKPRQYVAIRADITERRRAEEALRQSERRLRLASHAAGIGAFEWNLQTDAIVWSQELTEMHGLPDGDFPGTKEAWRALVHPDDQETSTGLLDQAFDSSAPVHGEWRIVWPDGSIHWIAGRFQVYRDEDGVPLWLSGVNLDVTERKDVEREINELNAELEQRVARRTEELEIANKELESFSYSVSHDLRAPLRAIDGFSQAVIEDYGSGLPKEGQRYLQVIRDGAQRMGMLIDDLLTFSRLSRAPLSKQTIDTSQLVREVLDDLRPQKEDRQVDLTIQELPACAGDPALLKQVWLNLLSNALKYSKKRERAVIEIGSEATPQGPAFFVRDNGTGFDMRYAHKLFGVFQRLHRAEDYEGTGVGLALVQRIIHRHGGRVWAEAAVDRGATFYFTLPEESIS